ncbi:uncharacterized protein K452DRAFT_348442 [Aplosporella prunicola CBS 121167]|uniref:Cytochrome P450 n=1 Tax=Aplosporella prunicola CBS 121167 TaxID=1176127 RepID=A0A6A6BRU4_9PEZI|nr:uncharacterized protein K452DRAFT_348442 [Aplosporella prunicola CBS 121167]KAF2146740.1 hypothetical protein K452DRAFT_348442 [Aplosporella prunicola CBS 121167]
MDSPILNSFFQEKDTRNTLVVASVLFLMLFLISYFIRWLLFVAAVRSQAADKKPSTIPYLIPLVGNIFSYISDPFEFVTKAYTNCNGNPTPICIKLVTKEMILVRGSENIKSLWRQTPLTTPTTNIYFVLRYMFGLHAEAAMRYLEDNSGMGVQPHPESNVAPHNRIDFQTHKALHQFLEGVGLAPFFDRFQKKFSQRLNNLPIGAEWVEKPDMVDFLTKEFLRANLDAMCSPAMLNLNPEFPQLFWEYNDWIVWFTKGVPRIFMPKGYAVRDKLLKCIKKWHCYAAEQTEHSKMKYEGEEDPFWGCRFFRERRQTLGRVDNYDEDALASMDLGAIWGFNTNLVLASLWAVMDVFDDVELLARVPREVEQCVGPKLSDLDVAKLLQQPVLQAVYAETLRLRVHLYIVRYSERDDLVLGDWKIPKKSTALACTSTGHMDEEVWDTRHRFLVYRNDPDVDHGETPKFSVENMAGSWYPFGGGVHMCPGRHFAKRAIIATLAMMVMRFDVEVTADVEARRMKYREFGLGTQCPHGPLPFRIRRR